MKLTKYEKEAIVRAIMQDVPAPTEAALKKEMQDAFVAGMSAPIKKLYKTHANALKTTRVSSWDSELSYGIDFVSGDADYAKVIEPFKARKQKRDDAHNKLHGAVMGCSTRAQLNKLLPEFSAYFPTESTPTKNLPAVANMVADLTKLGWPKKASKVATA
jgi:hypothetical protein